MHYFYYYGYQLFYLMNTAITAVNYLAAHHYKLSSSFLM